MASAYCLAELHTTRVKGKRMEFSHHPLVCQTARSVLLDVFPRLGNSRFPVRSHASVSSPNAQLISALWKGAVYIYLFIKSLYYFAAQCSSL